MHKPSFLCSSPHHSSSSFHHVQADRRLLITFFPSFHSYSARARRHPRPFIANAMTTLIERLHARASQTGSGTETSSEKETTIPPPDLLPKDVVALEEPKTDTALPATEDVIASTGVEPLKNEVSECVTSSSRFHSAWMLTDVRHLIPSLATLPRLPHSHAPHRPIPSRRLHTARPMMLTPKLNPPRPLTAPRPTSQPTTARSRLRIGNLPRCRRRTRRRR